MDAAAGAVGRCRDPVSLGRISGFLAHQGPHPAESLPHQSQSFCVFGKWNLTKRKGCSDYGCEALTNSQWYRMLLSLEARTREPRERLETIGAASILAAVNTEQPATQAPLTDRPEDPEITREILFYCARERSGKPAHIDLQELESAFSWISRYPLKDHVKFAIYLELLHVEDMRARRLGGSEDDAWIDILDVTLSGLTPKGREYVKQARTPQWRKAYDHLKESGGPVTTAVLFDCLVGSSEA